MATKRIKSFDFDYETGPYIKPEEAAPDTDNVTGLPPGATKYDAGKAPVWQGFINYFPRAIEAVAQVSGFGAEKYDWNGWEAVPNGWIRYKDAQLRHLLDAAKNGRDATTWDSNLLDAAHEAWGAMATLELLLRELEE